MNRARLSPSHDSPVATHNAAETTPRASKSDAGGLGEVCASSRTPTGRVHGESRGVTEWRQVERDSRPTCPNPGDRRARGHLRQSYSPLQARFFTNFGNFNIFFLAVAWVVWSDAHFPEQPCEATDHLDREKCYIDPDVGRRPGPAGPHQGGNRHVSAECNRRRCVNGNDPEGTAHETLQLSVRPEFKKGSGRRVGRRCRFRMRIGDRSKHRPSPRHPHAREGVRSCWPHWASVPSV